MISDDRLKVVYESSGNSILPSSYNDPLVALGLGRKQDNNLHVYTWPKQLT